MTRYDLTARAAVTVAMCALGACLFNESGLPADGDGGAVGGTPPDGARADLGRDATDGCQAWVPIGQHFDPCNIAPPGEPLVLDVPGMYIYHTDLAVLIDPNAQEIAHVADLVDDAAQNARLISADSFAVGPSSSLRVIGSLPLIVASWSTIVIDGVVDSSGVRGQAGAGADQAVCEINAPTPGQGLLDGGAGGGGGGFSGLGGDGGDGKNAVKGAGGVAVSAPSFVRGGCGGAAGGDGGGLVANGGNGGPGGGAVQLTARDRLIITGTVSGGGAGGYGGGEDGGGGGGGSGGYIGLDAPIVIVDSDGVVVANGGAGGEAGDANDTGEPGGDAVVGAQQALGGKGGADKGGDGGGGGFADNLDGSSGKKSDGGGGGGGGAGMILVFADSFVAGDGSIVSPVAGEPGS